mmetsp:Transcript_17471/g.27895  ORF Transcript_17471/g.27895 Transcript_17471/m.27895 type:complete len:257 (+) Transcript_17471:66-836(+)
MINKAMLLAICMSILHVLLVQRIAGPCLFVSISNSFTVYCVPEMSQIHVQSQRHRKQTNKHQSNHKPRCILCNSIRLEARRHFLRLSDCILFHVLRIHVFLASIYRPIVERLWWTEIGSHRIIQIGRFQQRSEFIHLRLTDGHRLLHNVPSHCLETRRSGEAALVGNDLFVVRQQSHDIEFRVIELKQMIAVLLIWIMIDGDSRDNHVVEHLCDHRVWFTDFKQYAHHRQHVVVVVFCHCACGEILKGMGCQLPIA